MFRWSPSSSDWAFRKQEYCHIDHFNMKTQTSAWHVRDLIVNERRNEPNLSNMQQSSKYDLPKLYTAGQTLPYAVRAVCSVWT